MPMIFCPTCESMLEVDQSSIGQIVECGSCKAQFTAKIPEEAKPSESQSSDDTWKPKKKKSKFEDFEDDPLREGPGKKSSPGDGMAVASLVLGIVGVVGTCCCNCLVVCDVLAIIFGSISLKSKNKGMAMAGLILGLVGIILKVVFFFLQLGFNILSR